MFVLADEVTSAQGMLVAVLFWIAAFIVVCLIALYFIIYKAVARGLWEHQQRMIREGGHNRS